MSVARSTLLYEHPTLFVTAASLTLADDPAKARLRGQLSSGPAAPRPRWRSARPAGDRHRRCAALSSNSACLSVGGSIETSDGSDRIALEIP
jgi:hypothetical protein